MSVADRSAKDCMRRASFTPGGGHFVHACLKVSFLLDHGTSLPPCMHTYACSF